MPAASAMLAGRPQANGVCPSVSDTAKPASSRSAATGAAAIASQAPQPTFVARTPAGAGIGRRPRWCFFRSDGARSRGAAHAHVSGRSSDAQRQVAGRRRAAAPAPGSPRSARSHRPAPALPGDRLPNGRMNVETKPASSRCAPPGLRSTARELIQVGFERRGHAKKAAVLRQQVLVVQRAVLRAGKLRRLDRKAPGGRRSRPRSSRSC